ncbi:MAG: hypothetical protein FWE57_01380 [Chitinispirillia bacterium]|nr:hypothetical protein [Chitinispirillia bacterium]
MQMDMTVPSLIFNRTPQTAPVTPARITQENPSVVQPQQQQRPANPWGPAAVVTISPEGRAAYEASLNSASMIDDESGHDHGLTNIHDVDGCQTCSTRTYVDKSNDGGVSFQTPTHIAPSAAAAAVAAHEGEHIARDGAKAEEEGREVISQSVRLHTSVCPECGITYVSGGEAKTVSASKPEDNQDAAVELLAASIE